MDITVNLPDGSRALFPPGTSPDAIKAAIRKKFPPTQQVQPRDELAGLPIPGTRPTQGYYNEVPPNETFGTSSSSTLNPLPAINAYGNQLASNVPAVGNALRNIGENFDAALDNAVYRPLRGIEGTTTPEDVRATNNRQARANPVFATAGAISGEVLPYLLASRVPGGARLLGMEGQLPMRVLNTFLSSQAINTADNMSDGKSLPEAFGDALLPSAFSAPFGVFGRAANAPQTTRQTLADALRREGVPLTAGQESGSKWLRYREGELGGNAAQDFAETQGQEFTRAALERAGIQAREAAPDVIRDGFARIGADMDRLAYSNVMPMDQQLSADLANVVRDYNSVVNPSQRAPIINETLQDLIDAARTNGNRIDGAAYQRLRSRLERSARGTADPELADALRGVKNALDDAMERGIAATNPNALGAWQISRRQYRNLLVIEDAMRGAGDGVALGMVTPQRLRAAVVKQSAKGWTRGFSDFEELARAGNATMAPLPDSGTASRIAARLAPFGLGGASGAAAGMGGGTTGMILGGLAGAVAPSLLGRALLSGPARETIGGRGALAAALRTPEIAALARGVIHHGAQ